MSRTAAWSTHLAALAAGVSGLVYGWMRYFAEPADEFALVNHPLEPTFKNLHILLVPLLVFTCGVLWRNHVWRRIRAGLTSRRRTGLGLALLLAPMIVSGYALQVSTSPNLRLGWMWIHGISGSLWVLVYLVHQLSRPGE